MIWVICFWTALCIAAANILITMFESKRHRRNRRPFSATNYLFFGIYAAVFCIIFPIYYYRFAADSFGAVKAAAITVLQAIKLMGVNDITTVINEVDQSIPIYPYYSALMTVLLVSAPFLTLSYVLSFLKSFNARLRLFFSFKKELYIFSALDNQSLALAADIDANHPKAGIVFTGVDPNKDPAAFASAAAINAVCLKKDITTVKLYVKSKHTAISFFTVSADMRQNTHDGLALMEKYRDRENVRLYVFFDSYESELLLNSADSGKIAVKRISYPNILVSHVLYNDGYCIFESAKKEKEVKRIRALVVGLGSFGAEMLKGLVWYCQMDGYSLELTAVDRNSDALDKLKAEAPEKTA